MLDKITRTLIILLIIFLIPYPANSQNVRNILISGIGTYINNVDVLTSYSAIMNCKEVGIYTANNQIKKAKLINYREISKGNLAILRTANNSSNYVAINNSAAKEQDQTLIIGLDDQLKMQKYLGKIAFVGDDKHDIEFISNEAKKGNSGSPLYNSKGYMVGILKGISTSNIEGRYVTGTSIRTIRQFAIRSGVRLSRPKFYGTDQTTKPNFYDNYGVNISCFKRNSNGKLEKFGSFGTGVFVNPSDVITNAHVVNNCSEINIVTHKKSFKGKLIAKLDEKQGDIAFIRTKAKQQNYAFYDDRIPRVGQQIFFPFFTQNRGIFKRSVATVSYVGNKNHGMEIIAPDLERITPGSPIFGKNGNLLGLLSTKLNYNDGQTLLIATPAPNISDFALSSRIRTSRPAYGVYNASAKVSKSLVKITCNK